MQNDNQQPPNTEQEAAGQPVEENWQAKADEFRDKWLRSAAEFDNYMKRQQRDRQKSDTELRIRIVKKLLPPLDDLDRALKHTPAELAEHAWVQGIILIDKKFRSILDDFNVKPMETVGHKFDPALHEALMVAASDQPEGTILEEFVKGYMLDDQVVRVASVKTSAGLE